MPQTRAEIDIGTKAGRWTTLSAAYSAMVSGRPRSVFDCRCDCGAEQRVRSDLLRHGKSLSCGCLQHEMLSQIAYRHGDHGTPLYTVWQSMRQRCSLESAKAYPHYGGRGIKVCPEWYVSFIAFREWANANGYQQGLEIDRRDNDAGYSAANCRWVTSKVNNGNRRNSVMVEAFGERKSAPDWAVSAQVCSSAIVRRLKRGWTGEQAVSTPARQNP